MHDSLDHDPPLLHQVPQRQLRHPEPVEPESNGGSLFRLTGFATFLLFLLVLRFVVPYVAEEIQYSVTRGKQRAEYELASEQLKDNPLAQMAQSYQLIAKRMSPSVVHINVKSQEKVRSNDEFSYLLPSPRREAQGQGSGVIMDESGYVVTNYHVVRGANEIEVSLSDGRQVVGHVVGADPPTDIAILKIDTSNLVAAKWGDSNDLEVGAPVWALGSPFGLQQSITFGILSAKNRADMAGTAYQDFLQTDAAVNPGNSGGPLVDATGSVVGINTAIVGQAYQGISFAVPSSVARDVYRRLREDGQVDRGWLGVEMLPVTEDVAARLGLSEERGALVFKVVDFPGRPSPARIAGIEEGDVVVKWNQRDIKTPTNLSRSVAQTEIGTEASVVVVRQGRELEMNVRVGTRPRRP